ncbi:MAG TPA: ABC transporter permease [Vicinamibacteria bacterium]|nr:ABC transporter permease [Vicinamibacteria bacterium]
MSTDPASDPAIDWRAAVLQKAELTGVDLPQSTVEELAQHLEDLYRAALSDGFEPVRARARVLDELTSLEASSLRQLKHSPLGHTRTLQGRLADDTARLARGRSIQPTLAFRIALRHLLKRPAFAVITTLVLGLGVGAATTIYSVVDSVVLRPLPYEEPDRLVTIWDTHVGKGRFHDPISPVNFSDQRELEVFEDAAAWWRPGINLADPGLDPIRVNTIEVSGNLFDLLGVRPQIGPGFPEGGPLFLNNELVAVISDRLWRSRYGASPSIVGTQLRFNDTPYTILGVMPAGFHYPDDIDVWERLRWDMTQHSRQAHFMEAVARLSEGTTIEQAQSAIDSLWTRLETETAGTTNTTGPGWGSRLIPLLEEQLGYYRPALFVLFGAVGLLLVIGVLNVATLLVTRALSREREIALRIALGASPKQLISQLMAESFLLSLVAAAAGVAAAAAALPLLVRLTPVEIPRLVEARIGWESLGVGLAIAAGTTLFFGLLPAFLLFRGKLTTDLKSGERGSSRGARRIYSLLVAGEVALACALLTSSALLVRTVREMMETPTGVDADSVLTTTIQLASDAYNDWNVVADTHNRIVERIREQPGVEAVGATNFLPFEVGWRNPFSIQGEDAVADVNDLPQVQMHSVSEGYLEAMGASLIRGRRFTSLDRSDAPGVLIVNESFARQYLSDRDAVGSILVLYSRGIGPLGRNLLGRDGPYPMEVVGVVGDIRNAPLGQPVEAALYLTTRQFTFRELFLAVRSADAAIALDAVRTALREVAPGVPMAAARTWPDRLAARTSEQRLLMTVLLFFGALAAILAALGVYGLFSWSVALRKRELAIRLTLGARPASVGRMVVRQSAALVAVGVLLGLVVIRLAESTLTHVLFGVSPSDAGSTLAASGLLVIAAILACVPPAIRAMRVDPVEGLRVE